MAGTIKSNVQLGDSATAANNFMLTAEANDGTLKLARGNQGATTQDVMTVDAAGKVSFPQNAQTWQTFTVGTQRISGTTYTNTTGQTIFVTCSGTNSAAGFGFAFYVGGVLLCNPAGTTQGYSPCFTCPVPAGATYKCDIVNMTGTTWAELR